MHYLKPGYYSIPGYTFIVNNRLGRGGGGVGLFVSCDLSFKIRDDLNCSTDCLESLFIEISIPKSKHIIAGVMYKPPSVPQDDFMLIFQNIFIQMAAENKSCFITGDFNINLLNYVHPSSQAFLDLI